MKVKKMRIAFTIFLIVLVFCSPCAARKEENDQKLSGHISEIETRDVLSIEPKNAKHPEVPKYLNKPKDSIHSTNPVHSMNPVQPRDTAHLTNTAQVPVQMKQNFITGSEVDHENLQQQLQSKKSSTNSLLPTEGRMIPSRRQRRLLPQLIVGVVLVGSEKIKNQDIPNVVNKQVKPTKTTPRRVQTITHTSRVLSVLPHIIKGKKLKKYDVENDDANDIIDNINNKESNMFLVHL